jgi:hypothetical protein
MEDVGIFYGHLVYFTAIWNILWTFGVIVGNLEYFPPFWYDAPRKIWLPSPILRLLNLHTYVQLQRQRCSRLERFFKEKNVFKTH